MSDPRLFKPFTIGERFRITPPDEAPSTDGRADLVIGRGAFGSGEHETTASCLELLEQTGIASGSHLLDLGSGTGILALAALHLGAQSAVCIDISPDAVRTCESNCALNGFGDKVRNIAGTVETIGDESFDLILANIYGDLLLDLAPAIVKRLKPGGHLLLSGMLWEYDFEVRKCYEKLGCTQYKKRMMEEFCTHLYQRQQTVQSATST
ncbi:MAG: SAM-dependent methyltransferase [Desulfuromonas sp.]|nr:MAG: SAM-dependent methyltransferase [Desulfuromonas sp.]